MKDFTMIMCVVLALSLTGCSSKTPSEFYAENPGMVKDRSAETTACLAWLQTKEQQELSQYDKIPATERGYALMHRETMSMVKDVWGKNKNVCSPGTNEHDAYIAWVREDGETKRTYAKEGGSTIRFGLGVGGAVVALDKLGGLVGDKVSGDKVEAGRDNVQGGRDVSSSGTNTQTNTNSADRFVQTQVSSSGSPNSVTKTNPEKTPVEAPITEEIPAP